MFGVTRSVANNIIAACKQKSPHVFFDVEAGSPYETTRAPAHSKVLNVLKIARFGTSMLAFEDYFQISESSVRIAFRCLFEAIASDDGIRAEFLRPMDRASAERVTEMHFQKYGVRGLAFPLDCMHVAWKNGPMVWHGQFKNGKNKVPTIVLEAGADSNLWFWHASFGFPGTLNDLTIWARSPLLESLESGHWIKYVDPLQSFSNGNDDFTHLSFLVDGIYPELAHFVRTIALPVNEEESAYAKWQAARKNIERAFGVLQSKWRVLRRKFELHDM